MGTRHDPTEKLERLESLVDTMKLVASEKEAEAHAKRVIKRYRKATCKPIDVGYG